MLKGAKKDLPKLAKFFLFVWLGTIFLFFYGIWRLNASGEKYFIHQNFFIVDVLLGIMAFLLTITFAILSTDSRPRKQKVELGKKSKKSPSSKRSKLSYYLVGGVVILLLSVAYLDAESEGLMQKSKVQDSNYLKKTSTPTTTPTSTSDIKGTTTTKTQPVVDSDPIIDCKFTHLGTIRLKRSVCSKSTDCQIGGKWVYYDSVDKCKEDQRSYSSSNTNNNTYAPTYTYPTYTPTVYYSCTLCYSSLGTCSTYNYLYETKAQCDNEQTRIDSLGSSYSTPTPQPTFDVDAYNALVRRCQRDVVDKYRGLLQSCNQYGGTSVYDACRRIYTEDRQEEYDACGQKL